MERNVIEKREQERECRQGEETLEWTRSCQRAAKKIEKEVKLEQGKGRECNTEERKETKSREGEMKQRWTMTFQEREKKGGKKTLNWWKNGGQKDNIERRKNEEKKNKERKLYEEEKGERKIN